MFDAGIIMTEEEEEEERPLPRPKPNFKRGIHAFSGLSKCRVVMCFSMLFAT